MHHAAKTKTEYATFWLHQVVAGFKSSSPEHAIHRWTHPNFAGGRTGWNEPVSEIYFHPSTIEERLLQGLIHRVLSASLEIILEKAERDTPHEPWSSWGGMDICEAYRIASMVAELDPLQAYDAKIRINKLCERMGESLHSLSEKNFGVLMGSAGMKW